MQALKPASPMGQIAASLPPAIATSTRSWRIRSAASPMASAPLAQAETVLKFGPFAPIIIETWPEAMSLNIMGMRNGLTRLGPRRAMTSYCSERVIIPPTPLPTRTATRSGFCHDISRPACSSASRVLTQANWENRSRRLASRRPRTAAASKSITSAAMRVSKPSASKAVM